MCRSSIASESPSFTTIQKNRECRKYDVMDRGITSIFCNYGINSKIPTVLHTEPRTRMQSKSVNSTELVNIVLSRNMFAFFSDERAFNIDSYFRTGVKSSVRKIQHGEKFHRSHIKEIIFLKSSPHLWSNGQRVWLRNQLARVRISVGASYLVEVFPGFSLNPIRANAG
ncbi:hypothetical protein ANN_00144 [Periplaneta americana]|uniref:Uncharacterized protein n=1 Tax=Periplaneta americana TaxID=6978 RepID=A0ABQ8TPY6_PERAM|nr:hypothetical protein ANN_00144 [Periplaneta americana]